MGKIRHEVSCFTGVMEEADASDLIASLTALKNEYGIFISVSEGVRADKSTYLRLHFSGGFPKKERPAKDAEKVTVVGEESIG